MQSPIRCSSCRGVSFESNKVHSDPFAMKSISFAEEVARGNSMSRHLSSLQRSLSKASSHYCDLVLDVDDDEEESEVEDLEMQTMQKQPVLIHEQQPKKVNKARKQGSRLSIILLDQGLFTVYKRLFIVCLALNITTLVLAATGNFPYGRKRATLFSIANILALTLCRSEAFLRIVFWFAVKALGHSWVPLSVKTATTSLLQSLGGVHSGCGVSSIAWLVYALVLTLNDSQNTSPEIVGVAAAILGLLFLCSLAAFPLVRHLHHNVFERAHRFAGWTALGLLWAFIVLTISYDADTKSYHTTNLFSNLIKQQEFWLTITITALIIFPWLTTRRVPVTISAPSGHASIIKFQGGVKAGLLGRISPSPLSEWHAFGIISDGNKDHMMLAGAVGDFTKSLVSNPPSHLWVRQVHFAGLPYLVNMYERVLVVATGSGICVFLSFLLQPSAAEVRFIWVAKGIEQNFGKEIKDMVSGYPKDKVTVHDTGVLGRSNVSEMSVEAAKEWGAQVVIVTSNPEGSRDVVSACKAAGIPAFGPIWDS
ncbi:adenylate-forming reductase 03009 [Humulus lupulus]|uniref:adenylate-forming reductase 03009 n=1 Tax=Humulus lupulus TaxID=3486 RepID=UPI002B40B233|nr:adenylate-forming reductase 03009 [Humulus lupulus]